MITASVMKELSLQNVQRAVWVATRHSNKDNLFELDVNL